GAAVLVNGKPIDEAVVQRGLGRVPPARREEVRPQLIDQLVAKLLVDQHLIAIGYEVEKADVDKRIDGVKDDLTNVNHDFDGWLADMKVTEAELREHVAEDLRWAKHASKVATDEELKRLFRSDRDTFDGSTVRAQHILLSAPKDRTKDGKAVEKKLLALR